MKLQILIPHYKEPETVIRPLLDSVALQQNVDFGELGVVIAHDGPDATPLPAEWHERYPFAIEHVQMPEHVGVSTCRNAALDAATADYVMFCDADDLFFNACGLWIVFREIENGGFDSLVSVFVEETRTPDRREVVYVNRENDSTFVHGKVHRRQFLLDNGIRWNNALTIHEDSYFNILCQSLGRTVKYCQTPFYLWRWRDESVCRHDPKYILKTYRNMLDSNDALIDAFLARGRQDRAMFYTAFMTFDAYYTMNKPEWINQENRQYRDGTELRFAAWFAKHKDLWNNVSAPDKMQISNAVRSRSVNEGMQMEAVTVDGWLRHIEGLNRKKPAKGGKS